MVYISPSISLFLFREIQSLINIPVCSDYSYCTVRKKRRLFELVVEKRQRCRASGKSMLRRNDIRTSKIDCVGKEILSGIQFNSRRRRSSLKSSVVRVCVMMRDLENAVRIWKTNNPSRRSTSAAMPLPSHRNDPLCLGQMMRKATFAAIIDSRSRWQSRSGYTMFLSSLSRLVSNCPCRNHRILQSSTQVKQLQQFEGVPIAAKDLRMRCLTRRNLASSGFHLRFSICD